METEKNVDGVEEADVAEEKKKTAKAVNLQIQVDDDTAQGLYSNLTVINHTETEFVADFIYAQPNQPKAKVRSRVILAPKHALRLLDALRRNIAMYEKKFGPIAPPKAPPKKPGDTLMH